MGSATLRRLEVADLKENDIIIAVVGLTSVGKSTFINSATGRDILDVDHNSTRNARTVQHVACSNPEYYGNRQIVFVEIPGFDSERYEGAIQEKLKTWLNQLSKQKLKIFGILYLYRITDTELWVTPPAHHLDMLESLCRGSVGVVPSRTMMVTTMWDNLKPTQFGEASLKEAEIQTYWDQLFKGNAPSKVQRFENSASSIVLTLLGSKEDDEWQGGESWDKHAEERMLERMEKERLERERKWLDRLEHKEREYFERKQRELLGREREWLERIKHGGRGRVDNEREWIRLLEQDEWARLEREEKEGREREERERLKREVTWLEWLEHETRERLEHERERLERLRHEEMERVEREKRQSEDEEREWLKRLCISQLSELMPYRHGLNLKLKRALTNLSGNESQLMANFLNQMLMDEHASDLRKRLLYFFTEVVKLTQVFPQCFKLSQAPCDLATEPAAGGAFSDIYYGRLRNRLEVCVKAVRLHSNEISLDVIRAHAGVFALSAHALHPNILPVFGIYQSIEVALSRLCIVFPWSKGGNLTEFLRNSPKTPRIPLLMDVISGLHYLHQCGIIHCDLNATNILVSAMGQAILSLSTITRVDGFYTAIAHHPGTINWMAPELLTADELPHYTEASDMWAFGCTCYEVMAGKTPLEEYTDALQLIPAFLQRKIDPSKLKPTPDAGGVWELVDECLNLDTKHRPSAEKAKSFLTRLNVDDNRPLNVTGSRPDSTEYRPSVPETDYSHLHTVLLSLLRVKQLADAPVLRYSPSPLS